MELGKLAVPRGLLEMYRSGRLLERKPINVKVASGLVLFGNQIDS